MIGCPVCGSPSGVRCCEYGADRQPDGDVPRDLEFERDFTKRAAHYAHMNPSTLIAFAEERSGTTPVRDLDARDFPLEVFEELADCRNYAVWWAIQIARHSTATPEMAGLTTQAVFRGLSSLTIAHRDFTVARGLWTPA